MTRRIIAVAAMILGVLLITTGVEAQGSAGLSSEGGGTGVNGVGTETQDYDPRLLMWNGEKMAPGTDKKFIITKINIDKNELSVRYDDRDQSGDKVRNVNIVWGVKGDEYGLFLNSGRPFWAIPIYNSNPLFKYNFEDGKEQLLQSSDISTDLKNNLTYQMFYAIAYEPLVGDWFHRYNKIDYSDCMTNYQPGVECVREEDSDGRVSYAAYLDGKKVEKEQNEPQGGEGEGKESEENTQSENNSEQGGGNDAQEGSNGEQKGESKAQSDKSSGQGESLLVARQNQQGYGIGQRGVENEAKGTLQDDSRAEKTLEIKLGDNKDNQRGLQVPELGDESEQGVKRLVNWPLLVVLLSAGLGLLMWWFLPIYKRRKDDKRK